jgi:tRNA A37 methylthiotransferase MiaB
MDEIYAEVKEHLKNGVEEIVLLGQIVNKHPDFAQILRDVSAMK